MNFEFTLKFQMHGCYDYGRPPPPPPGLGDPTMMYPMEPEVHLDNGSDPRMVGGLVPYSQT